jgi:hypothetical protein
MSNARTSSASEGILGGLGKGGKVKPSVVVFVDDAKAVCVPTRGQIKRGLPSVVGLFEGDAGKGPVVEVSGNVGRPVSLVRDLDAKTLRCVVANSPRGMVLRFGRTTEALPSLQAKADG